MDLRPVTTGPATSVVDSSLHTQHQPTGLTHTKLIMLSIWQRKPKVNKPVAAIVVQVVGHLGPEVLVFQKLMFCDMIGICLRRLRGPD